MKKLLALSLLLSQFIFSQTPAVVQQDLMNFKPGELIVKLKDNVDAGVSYQPNGKAVSDFNIGELLGVEEKIASSKVMFHQSSIESSISNQKRMAAIYAAKAAANPNNGYQPEPPKTMKNVFVLTTTSEQENILMLVEELKDNPNIDYAEPNYIYGIDDFEVVDVITAEKVSKMNTSNNSSTIEVNDPLYSSQTNITTVNIDDVWEQYTTGDGSQVVAVLDTGGDYTHPDLEANTWINEAELNGVEGYDDDGNGYIDDIRGWDFINIDNAPLDDNTHGTHVAGIIGAVGNNGIGIAGAAWDVKLMHIKVFQSTGVGNSITIAEGVEYASSNGANILNMSFGSYGQSSTLSLALENAYATAILVASAGNNGKCIGPGLLCAPAFPAAYSYVFGVEDRPRPLTGYTNYDQDGPVSTLYTQQLLNYELAAPGTQIMSTIPGGGYASLTGTSMSAPLVAGALALYSQVKPNDSKELMIGNLINTSPSPGSSQPGFVDILAAIEVEPTPELAVLSSAQRDTINGQNGDGFWQPGETIEILPLVKNYWGPTEDVRVGIAFAEFEDTTKATIVQDEIQIGSISAYATLQDLEETLKITISEGVANNIDIKFVLTVWSGSDQEYLSAPTEIVINVKNSTLFYGIISEDITLTADQEYLISGNVIVSEDAVVTIEPGTILKFSDDITMSFQDNSKLICNGNPGNMIKIMAENYGHKGFVFQSVSDSPGWHSIKYTEISGLNVNYVFHNSTSFLFEDSILTNNYIMSGIYSFTWDVQIRRINYINNIVPNKGSGSASSFWAHSPNDEKISQYFNQHDENDLYSWTALNSYGYEKLYISLYTDINYIGNFDNSGPIHDANLHLMVSGSPKINTFIGWNGFGNSGTYFNDINLIGIGYGDNDVFYPALYMGSAIEEIIDSKSYHFLNQDNHPYINVEPVFDWSNVATVPYEGAHGIVWKVLVNGKDAQDEYDLLDPIGVGTHEFKVYFNREMDTSVNPQISYGVTIPYNQKIISETGTWSEDGKIYTVTHDVNIGVADGISRIRVQDAQDLDYFKIPVENSRFNILVQSAGSASAGWFATPGLGKIDLEWVAPDADEIDDALGYNMYRYQVDGDGVESDPVKLNETLIIEDTDESTTGVYFTDYAVLEGQTYFYKYNILRTSFETTDYSSVVSTAPLTSTLGDSNGDFAVDVLDLVHDVDYILGNNPEPFIFVAGDVNADNTINVLDIVGTVDIILNGDGGDSSSGSLDINFYPSAPIGYADFSWEGNDLYVESMHNVGGLQLAFESDFEYVLHDLPGIERLDYTQDGSKVLMLYSFNNTSIASTKTKLLTRIDNTKDIDINLAVAGTTTGAKLTPRFKDSELEAIESPFQSSNLEFLSMYPNPSSGEVTMKYYLPEQMDGVVAKVYDMLGRLVHIELLENKEGASESQMQLNTLQKGNYIVLISADKDGGTKHIANKMLIIK